MQRPRVLKLGGSLLDLAEFPDRLRRWIQLHPHPQDLLLVGGGQVVDAVRNLAARHTLPTDRLHWMCIDLLEQTASIVADLLPGWRSLRTTGELHDYLARECRPGTVAGTRPAIVHVAAVYSRRHPDSRLPENWDTTSDSLAALLAEKVSAEELVLFKSVAPPSSDWTPAQMAAAGLVDPVFPTMTRHLRRVRIVNLRDAVTGSESAP